MEKQQSVWEKTTKFESLAVMTTASRILPRYAIPQGSSHLELCEVFSEFELTLIIWICSSIKLKIWQNSPTSTKPRSFTTSASDLGTTAFTCVVYSVVAFSRSSINLPCRTFFFRLTPDLSSSPSTLTAD